MVAQLCPTFRDFIQLIFAKLCSERLGRGSGGQGPPHCSPVSLFWGAQAPQKGGSPLSSSPSRRGSQKFTGSVKGRAKRGRVGGWGKGVRMGKRGWEKGSGEGEEGGRRGKDKERGVRRAGEAGRCRGERGEPAGGAGKAAAKAQLVCSVLGRGLFWGRGEPWYPSENPLRGEGAGERHSMTLCCRDTGTELLQQPPSHSGSVPRTGATGL